MDQKELFDKFYDELIAIFKDLHEALKKDLHEALKKDLPSISSSESEVPIDEQKQ